MHLALLNSRLLAISLVALLFNDFYLKTVWPGLISGKLSDFAGISLVCLLLFAFLPKYKNISIISVIIIFSWWKSEWSTPFIQLLHYAGFDSFNRTIDYSDLWAFLVIPICYYHSLNYPVVAKRTIFGKVYYAIIVSASLFAITATSQLRGVYLSEFHFKNITKLVTAKQVLAVIDRVAFDYNFQCWTACSSDSQRTYHSKRGKLAYTFNHSNNQVEVIHSMRLGRDFLILRTRNDIKFLTKIRKRIFKELLKLNVNIKLKVITKPGYYHQLKYPRPIVPGVNTIHFNHKSVTIIKEDINLAILWAHYLAVRFNSKDPREKIKVTGYSCDYRKKLLNIKLAKARIQTLGKLLLYHGVEDRQIILQPYTQPKTPGKCSLDKRKVVLELIQ